MTDSNSSRRIPMVDPGDLSAAQQEVYDNGLPEGTPTRHPTRLPPCKTGRRNS